MWGESWELSHGVTGKDRGGQEGSLFSEKIKKCVWGLFIYKRDRLEGVGYLSTAFPQDTHRISTGTQLSTGYAQDMHRILTGYPHPVDNCVHNL